MFLRSSDIKKTEKTKIGLITNGVSADLIRQGLKCESFILVPVPYNDNDFVNKYNEYKEFDYISPNVVEIEKLSCNLDEYVMIHKKDYEKYLKFQQHKKINSDVIQQVQIEYQKLKSQRAVARKLGLGLGTVNKILKNI